MQQGNLRHVPVHGSQYHGEGIPVPGQRGTADRDAGMSHGGGSQASREDAGDVTAPKTMSTLFNQLGVVFRALLGQASFLSQLKKTHSLGAEAAL